MREGEGTNQVPDPDDSDVSSRDADHVGERPVSVRGDDRRDELGESKGTEERVGGSLGKEPAVRTSDENLEF